MTQEYPKKRKSARRQKTPTVLNSMTTTSDEDLVDFLIQTTSNKSQSSLQPHNSTVADNIEAEIREFLDWLELKSQK